MCTSLALNTNELYFGRNLDLQCGFGERVVVTPRNHALTFRRAGRMPSHPAIIGMAAVADRFPLYADAANEAGLCMAGLNFPDNAFYPSEAAPGMDNLSPFELILWVLGQCESVDEAETLLRGTHLVAIPFGPRFPLTPLHWHVADAQRSITVEPMRDGLQIHDNPLGILTNNPPFDFQMTHLRQYLHLTPAFPEDRFCHAPRLRPFGLGFGSIGLPGDVSPASRFVRMAFNRQCSERARDPESSVAQCFHLLDSVAVVEGVARTPEGLSEKTRYSCCIDARRGIYYCKTYENSQLTAACLSRADLDSSELIEYPLPTGQQVAWVN